MAHIFSVEIHDFLSRKIKQAEKAKKMTEQNNDETSSHYYEGQIFELNVMRQYLTENIDLKNRKYY
jgi:hypothetical protein